MIGPGKFLISPDSCTTHRKSRGADLEQGRRKLFANDLRNITGTTVHAVDAGRGVIRLIPRGRAWLSSG